VLNRTQFERIAEDVKPPGAGGTYDIKTAAQPKEGWAVATKGAEKLVPTKSFGVQAIEDYSRQHREALERTGHLGLWHEPDEGVYHDATHVYPASYRGGAAAIAAGYHEEQIAVQALHVGNRAKGGTTVYMRPKTASQKRGTEKGVKSLRRMAPQRRIAEMPTSELGAAIRNRRPV
jgi:hypothetical protein